MENNKILTQQTHCTASFCTLSEERRIMFLIGMLEIKRKLIIVLDVYIQKGKKSRNSKRT